MKKVTVIVMLAILMSACAPSIQVSNDYDKQVDFASYKTYKLSDDIDNLKVSDFTKTRLKDALNKQMQVKGFSPAENADILVDVKGKLQQEQSQTATTTGGGYYGAGYHYGWGPSFSTTTIDVNNYTVGTLFIDFIDLKKKQLIWQGRGSKTLEENQSAEKKEQRLNEAIAKILAQYPPGKK